MHFRRHFFFLSFFSLISMQPFTTSKKSQYKNIAQFRNPLRRRCSRRKEQDSHPIILIIKIKIINCPRTNPLVRVILISLPRRKVVIWRWFILLAGIKSRHHFEGNTCSGQNLSKNKWFNYKLLFLMNFGGPSRGAAASAFASGPGEKLPRHL